MSEADVQELSLSSYLAKFRIQDGDGTDGRNAVRATYPKAGHEKRKPHNREYLEIDVEQMAGVGIEAVQRAVKIRKDAADLLRPLIRARFSSFDTEVFKTTIWLDPKFWDSADKNYEKEDISKLCDRFATPLAAAGFENTRIFDEWRSLKALQRSLYPKMESGQLWEKIIFFRREEFPNLSLLVELALCISGSNSQVERGFSVLTLILSNRRLSMSHDMMECCIMIAANDPNWSNEERESLIDRAVDIYMTKRRTAVFSSKHRKGETHGVQQSATSNSEGIDATPLSTSEDETESEHSTDSDD